jgi:uncharacterized protein
VRLLQRSAYAALACFTVLAVAASGASAAPVYPEVGGWIVDEAEQVPAEVEERIEATLEDYHRRTNDEIAIAVVPNLGGASVEDYTNDLFNRWGVGDKKRDVGVLMVIAMEERKLRIETGYGAEATLTDLEAKDILDDVVRPRMRAGDVGGAVDEAQRAIRSALGDTAENTVTTGPPPRVPEQKAPPLVGIIFSLLPFLFMAIAFSTVFGGRSRRRRRYGGSIWGVPIFYGGGGFGGYGGGGGFGGGDSGGGSSFGGFGGGSSGGGGASGSW